MQDTKELLEDFTRLVAAEGSWTLQVGVVNWEGTYTPFVTWKNFRKWQREPTECRLMLAKQKALEQRRFFLRCNVCTALYNVGHMSEDDLCQGCAERYFGVVH